MDDSNAGSIYRYEDDKGTVVMTSDLEKVPTRYRAKMKVLDGSPHDDQQRTTVIVKDHRVYVPVIICYQGKTIKVNLILDTGATGITISPAIAQRLEIKSNDTRQGISIIANGTRVANYSVIADYVTVGPKIKRDIELQVLPRNGNEEEGLLGMSFLGDFPHMIDTKAQVIKWM